MRILVTAGPTREYIDDVRFLSNASSGLMGYEIARAARQVGHTVTLISGPTSLKPPARVRPISVISANEMFQAVRDKFDKADCVIMTAAVADYRPARRHKGKIKKSAESLTLDLKRNTDILDWLGKRKGNRVLIGFALEPSGSVRNARQKLNTKNLDAIVLNTTAAIGKSTTSVQVLDGSGVLAKMKSVTKRRVAQRIIRIAEKIKKGQ